MERLSLGVGPKQEIAFRKVNEIRRDSEVPTHFDINKPLQQKCDASPHGTEAKLSHHVGHVDWPIGFCLRAPTKAERNNSEAEREALVLIFGVAKHCDFLWGRSLTLVIIASHSLASCRRITRLA